MSPKECKLNKQTFVDIEQPFFFSLQKYDFFQLTVRLKAYQVINLLYQHFNKNTFVNGILLASLKNLSKCTYSDTDTAM